MTKREAVKALAATRCACGANKCRADAFCPRCYRSLPEQKQRALYRRVGAGFENAYGDALYWLQTTL